MHTQIRRPGIEGLDSFFKWAGNDIYGRVLLLPRQQDILPHPYSAQNLLQVR